MSKVREIRTAITAALRTVHPRVYYERAPDRAAFPYLVFVLNAVNDRNLERYILDVDGWDAPTDGSTLALEQLMNEVDYALHKRVVRVRPVGSFVLPFHYVEPDPRDGLSFVIYRDRRLTLHDDDVRIRRRKYIYEMRTFERRRRDYHGW